MQSQGKSDPVVALEKLQHDKNFLIRMIQEFAKFKHQLFVGMEKTRPVGGNEDFSLLEAEIHNNANTLYSDMLSVYGAIVEEEIKN